MKIYQITDNQKAQIHILTGQLKWSREAYVHWLIERYDATSSTQLSAEEAADAIEELSAIQTDLRPTEKQINYIKYLWVSVDYAGCTEGDKLLNNFLNHRFGVPCLEQLTRSQAFGCIAALKIMVSNKKSRVGVERSGAMVWVTLPTGERVAAIDNPATN